MAVGIFLIGGFRFVLVLKVSQVFDSLGFALAEVGLKNYV